MRFISILSAAILASVLFISTEPTNALPTVSVAVKGNQVHLLEKRVVSEEAHELHQAMDDDLSKFFSLMEANADVNTVHYRGQTLLHRAVWNGQTDVVKYLLERDANMNVLNANGYPPIYGAIAKKNMAVVNLFMQHGFNFDDVPGASTSPLYMAATHGFIDLVTILLNGGAKMNVLGPKGESMLNVVIRNKDTIMFDLLLKKGALESYVVGEDGITPLHVATEGCNPDIARKLLDRNVDPNIPSASGETPLSIAVSKNLKGCTQIIELLFNKNVDIGQQNASGDTPLHIAASLTKRPAMEKLLKKGADIEVMNNDGYTPLHYLRAAADIAQILTLWSKFSTERMPAMHFAVTKSMLDVIPILVSNHRKTVVETDSHGKTPIDYAYEAVDSQIIDKLIEYLPSNVNIDSIMTAEKLQLIVSDVLKGDDDEKLERLLVDAERFNVVLNQPSASGNTLLAEKLLKGDMRNVRRILSAAVQNPQINLDPNASIHDPKSPQRDMHPLDYFMNRRGELGTAHDLVVGTIGLKRPFDVNAQNQGTQRTALMNAISSKNFNMVQMLVETAIENSIYLDLTLLDAFNRDAYAIAKSLDDQNIANYLEDRRQQLEDLKRFELKSCPVCFELKLCADNLTLPCDHVLCKQCERQMRTNNCPTCRAGYAMDPNQPGSFIPA